MDSSSRETSREEVISGDSWVDLHFQQQQQLSQCSSSSSMAPTSQPIHSGLATPEIRSQTPLQAGLCSGQMEKLLLEAQRESRGSSQYSSQPTSSRGSPKSPHSPNNEKAPPLETPLPIQEGQVLQAVQKANIPTDWIWDWSSRPEAMPQQHNNGAGSDVSSNGGHGQYQHPPCRSRLSVRNSSMMKRSEGKYSNLTTLIVTHACTFILGAAAMFLYLKKYCNWSPPVKTTAIIGYY